MIKIKCKECGKISTFNEINIATMHSYYFNEESENFTRFGKVTDNSNHEYCHFVCHKCGMDTKAENFTLVL